VELTGNKWIDLLIVFVSAGGIIKSAEAVWKLATVRFDWLTRRAGVKTLELDTVRKEAETLAFLQMELKRLHKESDEARNEIEMISENSRKEIRTITEKSLTKLDEFDKRNTETYARMKEMRNQTLTLLARNDINR
jgi:hypothetical protein